MHDLIVWLATFVITDASARMALCAALVLLAGSVHIIFDQAKLFGPRMDRAWSSIWWLAIAMALWFGLANQTLADVLAQPGWAEQAAIAGIVAIFCQAMGFARGLAIMAPIPKDDKPKQPPSNDDTPQSGTAA